MKSCYITSYWEEPLKMHFRFIHASIVNGSRELQFNYNECNLIFLKSKTVITHMKRGRSDLHPFPSNWVNASRELQFNCNKCNFIVAKLNTFNIHMKKQHNVALGRHRITLLGKLYRGSQLHETKAI